MLDTVEPLLDSKNEKFTIMPITYPKIWNMYKTQQAAYWRAEEIDFSNDSYDFATLDNDEQYVIKMILAFFASSDGIVNFNLRKRFMEEIKITEALVVYGWQLMMENIHGEVYSLMLDKIIKDNTERAQMFDAIHTIPSIKLMADWAFKWIDSKDDIAHRLIAFAAVEGIFFSGAFACIFWIKKYRSKGEHFLNGLTHSNQLISRDEGLHCEFACLLYEMIVNKLPEEEVHMLIDDSVKIAKNFATESIKCDMIGMNKELMYQYLEYTGDSLLTMLGYNKKYFVAANFPFIESISISNKTNFFESRPSEYQSAFNSENKVTNEIVILNDF